MGPVRRFYRFGRLFFIGFILTLLYSNCSPVQFVEGEEPVLGNVSSIDAETGTFLFETTIVPTTISTSLPIDLIWVIDNSGSMSQEISLVRGNFASFVSGLERRSVDFKMSLISLSQGSYGVSLPASGSKYHQVEQAVSSTNALDQVAQAICPLGQTCGAVKGKGTLSGFLRQNSKKIVVVVTDDNSSMSAANFSNSFSAVYPKSQLALFGFIGIQGVSTCGLARHGSVYVTLAGSTGGSVYDICKSDWSLTFESLVNSIDAISQNSRVQMPSVRGGIERIVSVELNGTKLSSSQYQFDGGAVVITSGALAGLSGAVNVKVVYQAAVYSQ